MKKMSMRENHFLRGQWKSLVKDAILDCEVLNMRERERKQQGNVGPARADAQLQGKYRIAMEHSRNMHYSKAMRIIDSPGLATANAETVTQDLRDLHPKEVTTERVAEPPVGKLKAKDFLFVDGAWVDRQLGKSKGGTAVDLWGSDGKEMWAGIRKDCDLMDRIAEVIFRPMAAGYLPPKYRELLAGGRLVALSKAPKTGIRPICIGDHWRRLVAKGLHAFLGESLKKYFQEAHPRALQFGGGTENRATLMYHTIAVIA